MSSYRPGVCINFQNNYFSKNLWTILFSTMLLSITAAYIYFSVWFFDDPYFFYLVDVVKKIKNILFGSVFFVISKSFSTTLTNHQVSFSCLSNSRLNSSQSLICSQKIIFHWMVATMIHLKIIFW